jgi:hypothetical protein
MIEVDLPPSLGGIHGVRSMLATKGVSNPGRMTIKP